MKKIQKIALCAVMAVAASTSASTLYWQIDTDNAGANGYTGDDAEYAVLYATKNVGYSWQGPAEGNDKTAIAAYSTSDAQPFITDLGSYGSDTYSFFVELLNASGKTVFTQYTSSYDTLVSSGYVSTSALSVPRSAGSTTGIYNGASVPEPTSGLLLLMGASLLALRRRRQA